MPKQELFARIVAKKSFLCVGLDTDLTKIPKHLLELEDPQFEFNKAIIDATAEFAVAYKPNLAFYECYGKKGWESLEKTAFYIKEKYSDIFLTADAKLGDIGNSSTKYAEAFLQNLPFDAVTVVPYMGEDSVVPFLQFPGKWAVILALTSNRGSENFQQKKNTAGFPMYLEVLIESQKWGTTDNIMYVVGATKAEHLLVIREFVPNHFLLIPGVGAQGGSLQKVAEHGFNDQCGLLVNASRSILYAGNGLEPGNFALHARSEAREMQAEMAQILTERGLI